jgi:cellulose synthase/poly-beta-1,6-N-acetylglucosamine synthase-like glycosyltransferase
MSGVLLFLFELVRLLLRAAALLMSLRFTLLALRALPRREPEPPPAQDEGELPEVLVQLPLRNEFHVAERIVRAACALDHPRDRLAIQVLDDSDDATRGRLERVVRKLREQGHPVTLVARDRPVGFKAGALNEGLRRSRAPLVAIFDADNLPAPDFLARTLPYFRDPRVGFVQARWSFVNRGGSLLTRLQALVLDGLFAVSQHVQSRAGGPVTFNGTAGVIRRDLLEDIGGWRGHLVTEDQDVALRAWLQGWRGVHCRAYAVACELPEDMGSFRIQQRRWAFGTGQVLRALLPTVLRARAPLGHRLGVLLHLLRHAFYPLLLVNLLLAPFTTLYGLPTLVDYGPGLNLTLLALLLGSLVFYTAVAELRAGGPVSHALLAPLLVPLVLGSSLYYSAAFLAGVVSRKGVFVRTPKRGGGGAEGPRYVARWDPLCLVELVLGVAMAAWAATALQRGVPVYGAFMACVALGLLWVSLGSLLAGVRRDPLRRTPSASSEDRA